MRSVSRATAAAFALGAALAGGAALASVDATVAGIDAAARAGGNRRPAAVALGRVLFRTVWPAQVTKVRIDGAGTHEVAGLILSGVKFHGALTRAGFEDEVIRLVHAAFGASRVEEVDCWATVPLPVGAHVVVTGDMAQPTSRTVFAVTVRRAESGAFAERLRRGRGAFWDPAFAARLGAAGAPGVAATKAQS